MGLTEAPAEEVKPVKKKARNGKAKGGSYERTICRRLSFWVQGTEKPEIFWRSASSGAQATQSKKRGHKSNMGGDIMAVDPAGFFFTKIFSVELKSYKAWAFDELLKDTKGKIKQWWNQCCEDAEHAGKLPFLVFKKNGSPDYVMICAEGRALLMEAYGEIPQPSFHVSTGETVMFLDGFIDLYDAAMLARC